MVSVVIANSLHREVVEGLLAAGKHVLCEKPLSDTLDDARAMAAARRAAAGSIARIGFTFRRTPGIAYIRDLIQQRRAGQGAALQRPLLDRLRLQPARRR